MQKFLVLILCFVSLTTFATAGEMKEVTAGDKIVIHNKYKVDSASCEVSIPNKIRFQRPTYGTILFELENRPISERVMKDRAAYGCVGKVAKQLVVYYKAGRTPGQEAFTLTMQYDGKPIWENYKRTNQTPIRILVSQD
ncbi:MAG: hypothetical protein AAGA08_01675 [Pseudomonadota bacterium]